MTNDGHAKTVLWNAISVELHVTMVIDLSISPLKLVVLLSILCQYLLLLVNTVLR